MVKLQLNLLNFPFQKIISEIFKKYSDDYEFTADGVFRKIVSPSCPACGHKMSHNGSNVYCKEFLGSARVGRYICGTCKEQLEEDRDFWINLKEDFFKIIEEICVRLKLNNCSYEGAEEILSFLYPRDKDTIRNIIQSAIAHREVPRVENIQFVGYDEQHLKVGGVKKYRLTLIDIPTRQVIAEELADSIDGTTIERFFRENLDIHKPVFIVTDFSVGYDNIFERIFGNKVTHQLCHFHLGQLIVDDFPKKTSVSQEFVKYQMLNIFYNRDLEIGYLSALIEEERIIMQRSPQEDEEWTGRAIHKFRGFVHELELKRRREKKNLEHRTYDDAVNKFNELFDKIESFEIPVQKRLKKINEHWQNLTAFYWVPNSPATNNIVENYYSTSLKSHRKNQLDTIGIQDQMKLSALDRAGIFGKPMKTLLDVFIMFIPFRDLG